jgi:hypothetical protein
MDDLLSRKSAEFGIAAARMEITESLKKRNKLHGSPESANIFIIIVSGEHELFGFKSCY